jgi:hypothetical protein
LVRACDMRPHDGLTVLFGQAYIKIEAARVVLEANDEGPAANGWPSGRELICGLVRRRGLEPLCLAALAPQASASANFATSAICPSTEMAWER